jgi:hypothetical protein
LLIAQEFHERAFLFGEQPLRVGLTRRGLRASSASATRGAASPTGAGVASRSRGSRRCRIGRDDVG